MEIAALICNKKTDYDFAFRTYSIYEYLKSQGNQVQIVDYNILKGKKNKKTEMLYNFLSNNTVLTVKRYVTPNSLENNAPLADKYLIVNGDYNDLSIKIGTNDNVIYGAKNLSLDDINHLDNNYSKFSTYFHIGNEEIKSVIDPLFLLSRGKWNEIVDEKRTIKINSNYIFVYGERVTREMIKYARLLSKKDSNAKIYLLSDKVDGVIIGAKKFNNLSPYDLAYLISRAQDVITSSDDGIKLSVIFDRSLHIFPSEEEQIELISDLKLKDRIVKNPHVPLSFNFNHEKSYKEIEKIKNNSYEFLKIEKSTSN